VKLLIDVYCQYRGKNNGDLTAAWSVMKKYGWTSKSQLRKALVELEARGWLVKTRQGSINKASLYAVTFWGIDYCGGKLDPGITPNPRAIHLWKLPGYEVTRTPSNRAVRRHTAHCPDLDTGLTAPHGGSTVTPLKPRLPRVGGQSST